MKEGDRVKVWLCATPETQPHERGRERERELERAEAGADPDINVGGRGVGGVGPTSTSTGPTPAPHKLPQRATEGEQIKHKQAEKYGRKA